jgi:hypothetical protein
MKYERFIHPNHLRGFDLARQREEDQQKQVQPAYRAQKDFRKLATNTA